MIDRFEGDYRFLSNFYPWPIRAFGLTYPSVEAAYQAMKTTDKTLRVPFTAMSAAKAKHAGRRLPLRDGWEQKKVGIMERLLREKFSSSFLGDKLLATGTEDLVEGNWWGDTYWGVCRGQGENMLGKLLMKVRADLRRT